MLRTAWYSQQHLDIVIHFIIIRFSEWIDQSLNQWSEKRIATKNTNNMQTSQTTCNFNVNFDMRLKLYPANLHLFLTSNLNLNSNLELVPQFQLQPTLHLQP